MQHFVLEESSGCAAVLNVQIDNMLNWEAKFEKQEKTMKMREWQRIENNGITDLAIALCNRVDSAEACGENKWRESLCTS